VEVESEGLGGEKVVAPVVAMRAGGALQLALGLVLPRAARLVLVRGRGPLHLVGHLCTSRAGGRQAEGAVGTGRLELDREEDSKKRKAGKECSKEKRIRASGVE
jgi:hypothetical protein